MNLILASALLVALPLGFLAWTFLAVDRKAHKAIQENLTRSQTADAAGEKASESLFVRIGRHITPDFYIGRLERPASMPLERLLAAKPVMALAGTTAGLLLISSSPEPIMRFMGLMVAVAGYFISDLLLMSKGQERQKAIQLELPNTMDQMLISVEAGLGFEGAMARAGENGKGPLAEELIRTLQDMQVGRSRRESYLALVARTNVPELRSFVQAVVQADKYGIAISNVLRVQAKVMRVKRRQRAEEKAMKLPVKVLFPLLFFIFPVLFIAILGPAAINTLQTFNGG